MCSNAELKLSQDTLGANVKTLTTAVEANTKQQATTNETLAGLRAWVDATEKRLDKTEAGLATASTSTAANSARGRAWVGALTLIVALAGLGTALLK